MTTNRLVNYQPSAQDILALENQLTTAFNDTFDASVQTYQQIATVLPMDEAGLIFGWLTSDDDLELFDANVGRTITQLKAHGSRIQVNKYTKTLGLSFDDIRDGKFTAAVMTAAGIGRSTKRHPDRLTYGVMKNNEICCYDGQPLFGTHPQQADQQPGGPTFSNEDSSGPEGSPYFYLIRPECHALLFGIRTDEGYSFTTLGMQSDTAFLKEQILFGVRARVVAAGGLPQFIYRSNRPLTPENLEAAVTAMNNILGPEGQPITNYPTVLCVPKSLRAAGTRLIMGDRNAAGAFNEWYKSMELLVSDYL